MLHPHWGYLAGLPNCWITFEDLMTVYRFQMVSSYERSQGNQIFANELSALSFWNLIDEESTGLLSPAKFKELMVVSSLTLQGFKFADKTDHPCLDLKELKREFATLENIDQEFEGGEFYRWDFARQIFV